jgi:hypothetical protein
MLHMSERPFSSGQTFWMKFVFPVFWISIFGLGTVGLFVGVFHDRDGGGAPEWMKWQFLAIWLLGSVFLCWSCGRLKKVRADSSAIYVSNYLTELRIPFNEIKDVTENRWIYMHPVTIHLRNASSFGSRVIFMPPVRYFSLWKSSPVVAELRQLAHRKDT